MCVGGWLGMKWNEGTCVNFHAGVCLFGGGVGDMKRRNKGLM